MIEPMIIIFMAACYFGLNPAISKQFKGSRENKHTPRYPFPLQRKNKYAITTRKN